MKIHDTFRRGRWKPAAVEAAQPAQVVVSREGLAGVASPRTPVPDYGAALAVFDINGSGDFDSDGEVAAALAAGAATDLGVVKSFVCAVIPAPTP